MDIAPLPFTSTLDQYQQQAEQLLQSGGQDNAENRIASITDAQTAVLDEYQFGSWPDLAKFVDAVHVENSNVFQFESAIEAIIVGEAAKLKSLIDNNPDLIHMKSMRTHESTLLIYVGANGVEGYRQKTPQNAVEITKILLDAGSDIEAVGKMYRGTTTLGLVATSAHPHIAGVQNDLIDILLEHGASMERAVAPDYTAGSVVTACLANGAGDAAEYLASRGAPLNLESAAGIGRLDVVRSFFNNDASLKPSATTEQLKSGFMYACGRGKTDVVEFLLQKGIDPAEKHRGATALHSASYGGRPKVVELLLKRNVPVNIIDDDYGGTPLGWALYGWRGTRTAERREHYYTVVELLVAAGGTAELYPLTQEALKNDPRMTAALKKDAESHDQV